MDNPVAMVLIAGIVGGLVMAWLILKLQRRSGGVESLDPFRGKSSTDVINMAHIRVAGIGGLGLVAMALTVAIWVPRIGQTLALGLVLGALSAAFLILRRRRAGPMPSSGRHAGANTTLAIDATPAREEERPPDGTRLSAPTSEVSPLRP